MVPGMDFDPTNNMLTNEGYIKVQYGRDYADVIPVRGTYRGPSSHELTVAVKVSIDEALSNLRASE